MKIKVKIQAKETENNETEVREVETQVIYDVETEEKKKQIDALLDHFEQKAASAPELIKDKDTYLHSTEFENLTDEDFDFNKKRREDLEKQVEHLEKEFEKTAEIRRRSFRWQNYAAYMLVLTAMTTCVTFSKYMTTVDGSSTGTVAAFNVSAALVDENGGNPDSFTEDGKSYDLKFTAAKQKQTYYVLVENNSDVTVDAVFNITGADNHTLEISTDGTNIITTNTVEINAGESQIVQLDFYGATKTVTDDAAKLTITVQQKD